MKLKKAAVNVGMTAAFPVFVFVVFWGITHLFNMQTPFGFSLLPNVLQNMGVGLLIALGMCINMTTQRIDLSAGAVTTVTAIFIGSIAAENNWPGWLFMLACIATGMLCSTFSGVVYVTLKLPPLVVSLGVTMILESLTVLYRNGTGITILKGTVREFGGAPWIYVFMIVAMVVFHLLMEHTGFSYDLKALAGNKRIATDMGISEKKNVILSYAISGAFFGLAALPYINYYGRVESAADMSSASVMFDAMLPVLIGGFLARFSNQVIAVAVSVFSMKMMTYGLICCNINNTMQNVISGIFIFLLVFVSQMISIRSHKSQVQLRVQQLDEKRAMAQAGHARP